MHDSIVIPACFSSGEPAGDEPPATIRSGQSVFMSVYRTKLGGQSRLITITWCKNLLLRGLSVSIQDQYQHQSTTDHHYRHKIELKLKPWNFWRKQQGEKRLLVLDGSDKAVDVVWDLSAARFCGGETEPRSGFYVAIVCGDEVALLVGDLKKDAFRRTGCPPSLIEPVLVSRREHLFAKRKFCTRVKFHHDRFHEIVIEFVENNNNPELEIRVDGKMVLHVRRLHWKFRGNEVVCVGNNNNEGNNRKSGTRVEVFWDVHDWLFGNSGTTKHGMFIFSPIVSSNSSKNFSSLKNIIDDGDDKSDQRHGINCCDRDYQSRIHHRGYDYNDDDDDDVGGSSSRFSFFVYAWKLE